MKRKTLDLKGMRFGNLVVIEEAYEMKYDKKWLCQCDCEMKIDVKSIYLTDGRVTSCDSDFCVYNKNRSKFPKKSSMKEMYKNKMIAETQYSSDKT